MKTKSRVIGLAALGLVLAACGGGSSGSNVKTGGNGPKTGSGQTVTAAAAGKFNNGLEQMAEHDKANDWSDATCQATAQIFLDAAKEQGDATFAEALYNAGVAYQRCKKDDDAKKYFKQALDKDPKFHRARVQLALYAFADSGEKDFDHAIAELRQAAITDAQFKNVEGLVQLGMMYLKRNGGTADADGPNDLGRAKKYGQSALAVDDGYMPAFNLLALVYFEAAKQKAGRAVSKVKSNANKEKKVDSQALDLAALVCSQAIRKNPNYASIHNTAGMIQVELGNLNSAVGEFNNARKVDPTFFEAQMNYAAVNLQFRGFKEAEEAYRAALKMRPSDYDAHLGLALALRGQIDESNFDKMVAASDAELEAAKKAQPDRPEAYFNQAILTADYKTKSGGTNAEGAFNQAKALYQTFAQKAAGKPEFADAVKDVTVTPTKSDKDCSKPGSGKDPACKRGRIAEIEQIIIFNKQTEKERIAAEADAKQRAAEDEAGGGEAGGGDKGGGADDKGGGDKGGGADDKGGQ